MKEREKTLMYELLGRKIKQLRMSAKISQKDLASHLNLSRPSIVNIEAGKQCPSIHLLIDISKRLDYNFFDFINEGNWFVGSNSDKLQNIESEILEISKKSKIDPAGMIEFIKKNS